MRRISDLLDLLDRLERLAMADTQASALAQAGETLASAVREALSTRPGGAHQQPWVREGTLRDSIGFEVDGSTVVVGSADPVAADQELGTRNVPPRPFLSPVGAALAETVTETIGAHLAALLER